MKVATVLLCVFLLLLTMLFISGCDTNSSNLKDALEKLQPIDNKYGFTLREALEENPRAISILSREQTEICFEDYTVYSTGGGIIDSINATRYSTGLIETTDRFVSYEYVVVDNQSGWLYIFENLNDISTWVDRGLEN